MIILVWAIAILKLQDCYYDSFLIYSREGRPLVKITIISNSHINFTSRFPVPERRQLKMAAVIYKSTLSNYTTHYLCFKRSNLSITIVTFSGRISCLQLQNARKAGFKCLWKQLIRLKLDKKPINVYNLGTVCNLKKLTLRIKWK